MGEFSAHRVTLSAGERVVIATPVNLYVSPYGDDVLNSGTEEGSPFRTPERAIEWLGDKYISDSGFVTIHFAAGTYDLDNELVMNHEQGNRVAFVGAEPEILMLQYVSGYVTRGFTADGYLKYYSSSKHGITLGCVRPSDSTAYSPITTANSISSVFGTSGNGVIIEDYDLVFTDGYNPAYYYSSYPNNPSNALPRQGSILGCHKLLGVSGSHLNIESSIRDDWFALPQGSSGTYSLLFGNPERGVCFPNGSWGLTADNPEGENNSTLSFNGQFGLGEISKVGSVRTRVHAISNVPVGYFGTNATTGITNGSTANLSGASFPNSSDVGKTADFTSTRFVTNSPYNGWYSATGPAGSILNDASAIKKNYHGHVLDVRGYPGLGSSASWRSVNSNIVTVKLIPTIFKRFGNILKIGSGGLRSIQNIFFDGKEMPAHYKLVGTSENGYSNKAAVYAISTRVGESMLNEPSGIPVGLFSNCGIKDFHVGVYADRGTDAFLGKIVISNCSYGILANNRSSVNTTGSVCTGIASTAYGSFSSSSMIADRCFASFVGQSLATLRLKDTTGITFNDTSFIQGQTYASPDGKLKGTVWDWDPRDKTLVVAVRVGFFEGGDPLMQ